MLQDVSGTSHHSQSLTYNFTITFPEPSSRLQFYRASGERVLKVASLLITLGRGGSSCGSCTGWKGETRRVYLMLVLISPHLPGSSRCSCLPVYP